MSNQLRRARLECKSVAGRYAIGDEQHCDQHHEGKEPVIISAFRLVDLVARSLAFREAVVT